MKRIGSALHVLICALVLGLGAAHVRAQESPPDVDPIDEFFQNYDAQPDEFSRFLYVNSVQPGDNEDLSYTVSQYLATDLNILGRPNDAIRTFPNYPVEIAEVTLPDRRGFAALPAVDVVARQARNRQILMVNEAHHETRTRLLTLALLPRLKALGYTHLAIETLSEDDVDLAARGYPIYDLTGYYTGEPVFGEIIRTALRLGFVVVPYEYRGPGHTQQLRETGQAENIVHRVFDLNPNAKLFVHAGYAHIDKIPGNLGSARPMAMELKRLTGIEPLSVDQTALEDATTPSIASVYDELHSRFPVNAPAVLVSRTTGASWGIEPARNDINVLLPDVRPDVVRPRWLSLEGRRSAVGIAAYLRACLGNFPCLAEARYVGESADAVPADQLVILRANECGTPLYLKPGRYVLNIRDASARIVATRTLDLAY